MRQSSLQAHCGIDAKFFSKAKVEFKAKDTTHTMKLGKKPIKMHVKKNDNVIVLAGNDKGKTGKVLRVFPDQNRVIVEGVNVRKRHVRPNKNQPQGGIIEREMPIHASNVKKI